MIDTKVLVVVSVDPENLEDLLIVMVARIWCVTEVSSIVRLEGMADCRDGNPYLVYGDTVAEFVGHDKSQTSITVADCRSGNLTGWGSGADF